MIRNDEPLLEAAKLMRNHHVGDVVVVEETERGRVPVAMLTDRDIVIEAVATRSERISTLLVRDVVRRRVVAASERDHLADVLKLMRSASIRRVPVVSLDGILVGVLAIDDVLEFLATELLDVAKLASKQAEHEELRLG